MVEMGCCPLQSVHTLLSMCICGQIYCQMSSMDRPTLHDANPITASESRVQPGPGGLNPSAVAGGPSVTRFTQSSCTGMSPSGSPKAAVKKMEATSPTLLLIMYRMKAFMLL